MESDLVKLDSAFTDHYRKLLEIQKDLLEQYKSYEFDLNKREITDAVHQRLSAFWDFNVHNNHDLLKRNVAPSAADFFTETCLLFFKSYFESKYKNVKVRSEKSIVRSKNAVRPDISIWSEDETKLIAAIELKINNGWKRATIADHLLDRERTIKSHFPNAYFGVISFWNFFNTEGNNWRTKYVGLQTYDQTNNYPRTDGLIEDIMKQIEMRL